MPNLRTINGVEENAERVSFEYGVYFGDGERLVTQTPDRKSAEALIKAIERSQYGVPPAGKLRPMLVSRKVVTTHDVWIEA